MMCYDGSIETFGAFNDGYTLEGIMSDDYKPLSRPNKPSDWGIQPLGPSPIGGDIHETFKTNRDGTLSGGHTTVRIPGGQQINLPWERK